MIWIETVHVYVECRMADTSALIGRLSSWHSVSNDMYPQMPRVTGSIPQKGLISQLTTSGMADQVKYIFKVSRQRSSDVIQHFEGGYSQGLLYNMFGSRSERYTNNKYQNMFGDNNWKCNNNVIVRKFSIKMVKHKSKCLRFEPTNFVLILAEADKDE